MDGVVAKKARGAEKEAREAESLAVCMREGAIRFMLESQAFHKITV